jgi:hypothetical protein
MATIFNPGQLLTSDTAPRDRPFLLVSKACAHDKNPMAEVVEWRDDLGAFVPLTFRYRLEKGDADPDEKTFMDDNSWHLDSPRPWAWIDVDFSQVF